MEDNLKVKDCDIYPVLVITGSITVTTDCAKQWKPLANEV